MVNVKCLTLFKRQPVLRSACLTGKFSRCPISNKTSKGDTCHSTRGLARVNSTNYIIRNDDKKSSLVKIIF